MTLADLTASRNKVVGKKQTINAVKEGKGSCSLSGRRY